ncbi:30S ribosomal protein S15 [Candidatus Parcubacteria bacterium]|nr:30S ribosomal protein S15 [Candidatus Parcubacteria bacterium]
MLTKTRKKRIISDVRVHDADTGSPEVQISLLTKRIEELAQHLKKHQKDTHSRRGLLQMVASRQTHMNYLQKKSTRRFNSLMKKLNLKKKAV